MPWFPKCEIFVEDVAAVADASIAARKAQMNQRTRQKNRQRAIARLKAQRKREQEEARLTAEEAERKVAEEAEAAKRGQCEFDDEEDDPPERIPTYCTKKIRMTVIKNKTKRKETIQNTLHGGNAVNGVGNKTVTVDGNFARQCSRKAH